MRYKEGHAYPKKVYWSDNGYFADVLRHSHDDLPIHIKGSRSPYQRSRTLKKHEKNMQEDIEAIFGLSSWTFLHLNSSSWIHSGAVKRGDMIHKLKVMRQLADKIRPGEP
jgi:hypothetical protein